MTGRWLPDNIVRQLLDYLRGRVAEGLRGESTLD